MTNRPDTQAVHAGEIRPPIAGAVSLPIFQSSTFTLDDASDYADLRYIRLNNTPNHDVLHAKIAALEGAEAALVAASGMAAICTTLLSLLKPGDHMIAQQTLYGGTHNLLTDDFSDLGIEISWVDASRPEDWAETLRTNTKLIYVESLSNPLLDVTALPEITTFAKTHGLLSLVDNTFLTPINYRPLEHGFDLVLHSATKYLNGHSDIVAGCVAGSSALIERVRRRMNHFGAALDPHACFLLHRGLKTLGLRVRQHNENTNRLARYLARHPAIHSVNHPSLDSHPGHARAQELFEGLGGVLSFRPVGGVETAIRIIQRLRLAGHAPSLGGVETLITRPCESSHLGMTPRDREAAGVTDDLVRVAVGIEAPEDLIEDFENALQTR